MGPFWTGFSDELTKVASTQLELDLGKAYLDAKAHAPKTPKNLASKLRGTGQQVSRDYLASMILGAIMSPLGLAAGKAVNRASHNQSIRSQIAKLRSEGRRGTKKLEAKIRTGDFFGRAGSGATMTTPEALSFGATGALGGSLFQMVRDRLSGAIGHSGGVD